MPSAGWERRPVMSKMKTTQGSEVEVFWVRPITEAENICDGRLRSIWGVKVNGRERMEKFTSKAAATRWVRANYYV